MINTKLTDIAFVLKTAQNCGLAHNAGAGGEYILCATKAQLLAFAQALSGRVVSAPRIPDYPDHERSRFYAIYDEMEKKTGRKPTMFDLWLIARGQMGTDGRRVEQPSIVLRPDPDAQTEEWRDHFQWWTESADNEVRHDPDWDDHIAEVAFGQGWRQSLLTAQYLVGLISEAHEQHVSVEEDTEVLRTIRGDNLSWGDAGGKRTPLDATPRPGEVASQRDIQHLCWAVARWRDEVETRPLINIHRRTLDDTWRQVIRHFGGDPDALTRPSHDALLAAAQEPPASPEPATSTEQEPKCIYLVATGEIHEGEETYTRYADAPPPLCDFECLYAAPQPPAASPERVALAQEARKISARGRTWANRLYNEPIDSISVTDVGAWIQYATQLLDSLAENSK